MTLVSWCYLEVWQLSNAGPEILGGSPQHPEDPEQLVNLGVALEQRPPVDHLGEDGSDAPNVDRAGVLWAAEENLQIFKIILHFLSQNPKSISFNADLGCSVPQGDHLVGVHSDGDPEGSSQPEVGDLDAAVLVDEKILGLHVSMENSPLVTEQDALQQLNSEQLFQLGI